MSMFKMNGAFVLKQYWKFLVEFYPGMKYTTCLKGYRVIQLRYFTIYYIVVESVVIFDQT